MAYISVAFYNNPKRRQDWQKAEYIFDVDAKDIENEDGMITVYTEVTDLNNAKKALENAFEGVTFELDEISYFANDIVVLEGEDKEKFERLLTMLDDIDDVSNVYHNVAL